MTNTATAPSEAKKFKYILTALIKNKLRFSQETKKNSKTALLVLYAITYLFVTAFVLMLTITMGGTLAAAGYAEQFFIAMLLVGAVFVLVFGIINLVSTLYLSKDTDFYSVLPVKYMTVFSAKLLFVYLCEAVIVVAVLLPAFIAFGIVVKAWAGYYIISILLLPIVPALPLILAAVISIPVMFIASKLKHRNIISLVFVILLYGAFFGGYLYLVMSMNTMGDVSFTPEQMEKFNDVLVTIGNVFYPFSVLARAAFKTSSFGLDPAPSVAVNLVIFIAISAALVVLIYLLGYFMYGYSAKSNNQSDAASGKKGSYKSSGLTAALIKREYTVAVKNTSTAFQCFGVFIMPLLFSVFFPLMFGSQFADIGADSEVDMSFVARLLPTRLTISMLIMLMPTIVNGAITSISREGVCFGWLKSLPLDAKTIVKSKVMAWAFLVMPVSLVSVIIINAFNFDVLNTVLSILAFIWYPIAVTIFGVIWDLGAPKLKWTDPIQAVKQNTHTTAAQFVGMIPGLVTLIVGMITVFIPMFSPLGEEIGTIIYWVVAHICMSAYIFVDIYLISKVNTYYNRIEL